MKTYEVELKTKPGFVWTHVPLIKVKANDKTDASYKALDIADKKLNFRKIAIEVVNVNEIGEAKEMEK
jgi:hypothetical protein